MSRTRSSRSMRRCSRVGREPRVAADERVLERWRRRCHALDGRPSAMSDHRHRPRAGRRARRAARRRRARSTAALLGLEELPKPEALRRARRLLVPRRRPGAARRGRGAVRAGAQGASGPRRRRPGRCCAAACAAAGDRRRRLDPGRQRFHAPTRSATGSSSAGVARLELRIGSLREPDSTSRWLPPAGVVSRSARFASVRRVTGVLSDGWLGSAASARYKLRLWTRASCRRSARWSSASRSRRRPSGSG